MRHPPLWVACWLNLPALLVRSFCVLDDVIPPEAVGAVREEVREAPAKNAANKEAPDGLRRTGRLSRPEHPVCDLVWMPRFCEHLAHPVVVAVAKAMLDDHLRIAQLNFRPVDKSDEEELSDPTTQLKREWHTVRRPLHNTPQHDGIAHFSAAAQDWPHDLSALTRRVSVNNAGSVRQPFPDVSSNVATAAVLHVASLPLT